MLIVFIFAVTPMPLDIMGIAAGNLRLPAWKFFLAAWPGKTIKYIILAYAGYFGWEAFMSNENLKTTLLVTLIAASSVFILLILAMVWEHLDWKKKEQK